MNIRTERTSSEGSREEVPEVRGEVGGREEGGGSEAAAAFW
jgi:hypothetical protein